MRYLLAAVLLALVWPPGPPPAPCGVIPDNGAPWWVISLGDNPQWLPCPSDAPPPTETPATPYEVRAWLPVVVRG